MKLSLVHPSWSGEFGPYASAASKVSTFPPLNLCLVAAIAERQGYQVQLIDGHIEGLSHSEILGKLRLFEPDLVGMTSCTPFFHDVLSLAAAIKDELRIPIMVGGTHASLCREEAFADSIDYLFVGECELNAPEFFRELSHGNRFPDVRGVLMRREGKIVYHGDAQTLDNLDEAPLPARHLLANDRYFLGTSGGRKLYTSVQMSRGCPFSCVFCANDLHGKRVRFRSPRLVGDELEWVVRKLGATHVFFVDDTLTLNREFILAVCDEIERRGLNFSFEGSTRANLWDEELVRRLRQCGLVRISFGLETADPRVREIIKKNVPLESYVEANRLCNRLGIETINSVIIGLPGDTRDGIEQTIRFLANARDLHHVTFNIAVPYPGTELHRMAVSGMHGLKLLDHDFSKYQRYGSAVMEVNGISPAELIALQQRALFRIYMRWWRILPTLRRFGLSTVLTTACRLLLPSRWSRRLEAGRSVSK